MPRGARTWILTVALALVSTSWLISQAKEKYPTPGPPYPKAKNWTLIVGPDSCTVQEGGKAVPVAVITRELHWIKYKSNAGQQLGIVFHAPPDNKTAAAPFKHMTSGGKDADGANLWKLDCQKDTCSTGPAVKGSAGGYWKTDQILDGKSCDAGIIIQP